jgi:hypothetical protein
MKTTLSFKIQVIQKLLRKEILSAKAEELLGCFQRSIQRYRRQFREAGSLVLMTKEKAASPN